MGLRVALALYYLTGMVGLRLAEAGLRGPPHVARMELFVRDDGPPPCGGRPPWASASRLHEIIRQGWWASASPRPTSVGLRVAFAWYYWSGMMVVFDASYPGETPEGAEALVAAVRGAVNKRFQGGATKPDTLMVDRGRGFYNNATGNVTNKYRRRSASTGSRT